MKKLLLILYSLLSWFIVLLILLVVLLFFVIESPSSVLSLAKGPLKEQGITYGEMKGGFLSGFTLTNLNYNNQAKIKEVTLKVDFEQLQNRVLYIDNLVLDEVEIEEAFLTSLIDSNSSDENSSDEGNVSLPFDTIVINNADISLKNTRYQKYAVHGLKLHVKHLKSDMKTEHKGDVSLWLDSNMAKADLNATINNESYQLFANIEGEKSFIDSFLAEQNVSMLTNPKLSIKADGNLEKLNYDLVVNRFDLKQNEYVLHSRTLHTFGNYGIENKDVLNGIKTRIDTNVGNLKLDSHATLNLDDLNNTLLFDVDATFKAKSSSLLSNLREQNITIQSLPTLTLVAKGDMKNVLYKTSIKGLKAKQNEIALDLKDLLLKGTAKPLDGDVKATLLSHFNSSLAGGTIDAKTSLNYKDLNNTLKFTFNTNLKTHGDALSQLLNDANVTLYGDSDIKIFAKGDMKNTKFSTTLEGIRGKQNDITFNVKNLDVKGTAKPLKGDVKVTLSTLFDSSVADGTVEGKSSLNYKDVNNTLNFSTAMNLKVHDKYINQFLKDSNITLKGDSDIQLNARGSMKALTAKVNLSSKVFAENILSDMKLETSAINIDLQKHEVDGSLKFISEAKSILLNLDSTFSGDYTSPEKMRTTSNVHINNFNAFGVDLTTLTPLKLHINSSERGADVNLDSKSIQLNAKSSDYDHFKFDLKSDKIYPDKLLKDLPVELKKKFIKVELLGEATVSKEFVTLKGYVASNEGFKAIVDATNNDSGLLVNLHTKHLKVLAKGNIKEKKVEASIDIDSITKVQEEFAVLYPFSVTPMNGPLHIKAKMKGEEILATITSPKIKMEGFNIEGVNIDAHYEKELLTLNKLSFKTTGFKDEKLNKDFYLNKKGLVHLGTKRDVFIDMHPKILVKMKGTAEHLQGDISIEALPLGHPDYGSMILSTQVHYEQLGKKKKIVGGISLEKMLLFYEAKFLDPAHDADVVVITKKDKKKKKGEDDFLENTFIDLAVYAPDAKYRTRDIKLMFTVDVQAKKRFGHSLGMLGKVREINGRVDQAPKTFMVVDSNIVFRGTKKINPLLDIVVEHELPDVLITIFIRGDANRPQLDFASDPSMAKKDILSYLLLGISTAKIGEGGSLGREAQLFIMNQAARDLAYEVELDRLFIKDDGTGEGYAVQVGKNINDNTMAIVENSKEGNSFIIEYEVNKNIKVEVGQHQKVVPSQSIDIFFRKRFK